MVERRLESNFKLDRNVKGRTGKRTGDYKGDKSQCVGGTNPKGQIRIICRSKGRSRGKGTRQREGIGKDRER